MFVHGVAKDWGLGWVPRRTGDRLMPPGLRAGRKKSRIREGGVIFSEHTDRSSGVSYPKD